MAVYEDITTNFSGGIAQNSKNYVQNACRFSRNLAIYEDDDSVTLTPIPVKDSGSVVTGLVKWIVDANPYENARYAYDDGGNLYKISNNVWTLDRTIAVGNAAGQGIVGFSNAIYYATATTFGRKYPLQQGAASYDDNIINTLGTNIDINIFQTASGNTYAVPTSITESAAHSYSFTPLYDPFSSVQFFVTARGTGNWTVTIHDSLNNTIATSTVANASLVNGDMNGWAFTSNTNSQVWWQIGSSYHFHITSTVNDGTIQSSSANLLQTAQIKGLFSPLYFDSEYHPLMQHTNGINGTVIIGNGNYIGQYDPFSNVYNPNQIKLEPGFSVRSFMKINEYAVAFCWKKLASGTTSIDSYEIGKAFFWDGIQPYYNFSRDLTQGMPNAVINYKNRMFGIFGSSGQLELSPDESSPFRRIQPAPKLTLGAKVEVLPGAIGVWQNRALFGFSNTNDTNAGTYISGQAPPTGMEQGVYEYGNQSDRAVTYTSVSTEVLNFAFSPSTAIANPLSFKIGCIAPFGKDCYVSYKDGSTYYVDRITKGNNPSIAGSWESMIADESFTKFKQLLQQPQKVKRGLRVVVTFAALPTGCTVTAKYRGDRTNAWTLGTAATAGTTKAIVNLGALGGLNYREIEYGFDITAIVNYPLITSVGLFIEPQDQEQSETSL